MKVLQTKQLLALIIIIFAVSCDRLTPEQRAQIRDSAEIVATRVKEDGPSAAATAKALAESAATRIKEDGPSAVATIRALGTPAVTLKDRLSEMRPDENGNVTISITEAELTRALTFYKPASEDGLRDSRIQLRDGLIILEAEIDRPREGTTLTVNFQPEIVDDDVKLTIVNASAGGIDVPRVMLNSAEARINNTLLIALKAIPGDIAFTRASANGGVLLITGARR